MQIHPLDQGTPEWVQFRLTHYGASEAAVMLGLSTKTTRSELLRMKHLGDAKQFTNWVQENILDYGHEVEALARPIVEGIIGDELYPVTCSSDLMPPWASYEMSASCDGLTMGEEIAFEHKQWNSELAASVDAGVVPDEHMPQCQQVLMITGAARLYFVVSDGTAEKMVYAVVEPDQEWLNRILAGWQQFDKDLAAYQLPEAEKILAAEPVLALPAVSVQVTGQIAISENFKVFEAAVHNFLQNKLIREPKTDQDFVNLDGQIKEMKKAEVALDAAEAQMLAQIQSVDDAKRQKDLLLKLVRDNRLMAEKLLAIEKERRRAELIESSRNAMTAHATTLQAEIVGLRLNMLMPDFAGSIKGLKSLASMQEKLEVDLANGKIAADQQAADLRAKLAWVKEHADEHRALLADLQQLAAKPMDDFTLAITVRIDNHKRAEAARLEAQREAIRKEEEDRVNRTKDEEDRLINSIWENARRIEFASTAYIEKAIRTFESGAKDFENDQRPRVLTTITDARAEMQAKLANARMVDEQQRTLDAAEDKAIVAPQQASQSAMPAQPEQRRVFVSTSPAPLRNITAEVPTLRLGQINERLAPIALTADGLAGLGFVHAATDKAAKLYHERDFPLICSALIQHIQAAQTTSTAQAA